MLKTYLFLFFIIICTSSLFSQTLKVTDLYSGEPVEGAVLRRSGESIAITDSLGEIKGLYCQKGDSIIAGTYLDYVIEEKNLPKEFIHIHLEPKVYNLPELSFSFDFKGALEKNIGYQIEILPKEQIEELAPGNTAELLTANGNVSVQRSQQGGGSPILRGFEANRVLIVVDGVKLNNAIYRSGHLQNVLTIDNNMIESSEVVFGPASSRFGSDALGGVMNFYTKEVNLNLVDSSEWKFNYSLTKATVDKSLNANATIEYLSPKFAYITSVSRKSYGDQLMGRNRLHGNDSIGLINYYPTSLNGVDTFLLNQNPNQLRLGGYTQMDVFHKQFYKIGESKQLVINFQHSNSSNINRIDKLYEWRDNVPRYSEWCYGPQKRTLTSITLTEKESEGVFNLWKNILSYQNVEESRVSRTYKSENRVHNIENVQVFALTGLYDKLDTKLGDMTIGYDFQFNDVKSTAHTENIFSNEQSESLTRYPGGGSQFSNGGIFVLSQKRWEDKWVMNMGARYNFFVLQSSFLENSFYDLEKLEYQLINHAPTINWGIKRLYKNWRIGTQVSTGFKAPNVDDFGKIFSKGDRIVVPNVSLRPEYTYNLDLSTQYVNEKWDVSLVSFLTIIDDIIVEEDAQWNNQDSILFEGEMKRVRTIQNLNRGWIVGTSFNLAYSLNESFKLYSNHNLQLGRRWDDKISLSEEALSHIPPYFGKSGIRYKKKKISLWVDTEYNGAKAFEYLSSKEQGDVLIEGIGYSSYLLFNAGVKYNVLKQMNIQLNLFNITDVHYIPFTSDISGAGRNIRLTIRGRF